MLTNLREMWEKYGKMITDSDEKIAREAYVSSETIRRIRMGNQANFEGLNVMYYKWLDGFNGKLPQDLSDFFTALSAYHGGRTL